jgi:hypothetical protein
MDLTFIVPSCVQSEVHKNQLIRCISSIRKYHSNNDIIIINDSITDIKSLFDESYGNLIIVNSLNKGSGELQTFYHILNTSKTEYNITMHDSMILENKIEIQMDTTKVQYIQFLIYFTNHRKHWDVIEEPKTQYNIENNIKFHTDLIRNTILTKFNHYEFGYELNRFQQYAMFMLNNKHLWVGCFACLCITTKSFITLLNNELHFIDIFKNFTDRRYRCAAESIFTLMCYYINYTHNLNINFENALDGLYYDGITVNKYHGFPYGFDNLTYNNRGYYFSKISFGRN